MALIDDAVVRLRFKVNDSEEPYIFPTEYLEQLLADCLEDYNSDLTWEEDDPDFEQPSTQQMRYVVMMAAVQCFRDLAVGSARGFKLKLPDLEVDKTMVYNNYMLLAGMYEKELDDMEEEVLNEGIVVGTMTRKLWRGGAEEMYNDFGIND